MKKIRTTLLLIFGILLLLVIASFIFSNTINSIHSNEQQINQYKESLFNNYNNLIKSQTESAVKLLEYVYLVEGDLKGLDALFCFPFLLLNEKTFDYLKIKTSYHLKQKTSNGIK
ncbi:hypothetical protein ACFPN4_13285 [Ureibacillus thermophilus]|uniref:hypothetical protein n=1 Tax=Ureibacillus thermophilus TaxID=367743 RepID=UPI003617D5B0